MSESLVRLALLLMRVIVCLPYPVVRRLGEWAGLLAWVYGLLWGLGQRTWAAKLVTVFGAFADFDSLVGSDPKRYDRGCEAIWPGFAQRRGEIATRRSALRSLRWATECP